jgi:hypothetical protein
VNYLAWLKLVPDPTLAGYLEGGGGEMQFILIQRCSCKFRSRRIGYRFFGGQRPLVPLLLGPPYFPNILWGFTTLLTGMTGISLHIKWPLTSQDRLQVSLLCKMKPCKYYVLHLQHWPQIAKALLSKSRNKFPGGRDDQRSKAAIKTNQSRVQVLHIWI